MEKNRTVIDNDLLEVEIPVMKEHIIYNDPRISNSSYVKSKYLTDEYRERLEDAQREEFLENRRKCSKIFGLFGSFCPIPPKKKSKEYWDAFRLGCIEGLNHADKFYVSESIDEELEKKFFEFLVENGIMITRNFSGSISISRCMPVGTYATFEPPKEKINKFFREVVLKIKYKEI